MATSFVLAGILAACTGEIGQAGQPPSPAELVTAHQRAVDRITAADVQMDVATLPDVRPSVTYRAEWRWTYQKENHRERIRTRDVEMPLQADGRPLRIMGDALVQDGEVWYMERWNCEAAQGPDGGTWELALATIAPQGRDVPIRPDPKVFLLTSFWANEAEPRQSLATLVRDAAHAEVRGPTEVDGHRVWHLHVDHDAAKTQSKRPASYDLFLDPSVDFLVRKVVTHYQADLRGRYVTDDRTLVVKRYRQHADAVFLPVETEYTYAANGRKRSGPAMTMKVRDAVINRPLPADALDYRFPENTEVRHRYADGSIKVERWGPDNRSLGEAHESTWQESAQAAFEWATKLLR